MLVKIFNGEKKKEILHIKADFYFARIVRIIHSHKRRETCVSHLETTQIRHSREKTRPLLRKTTFKEKVIQHNPPTI